MKDSTKSTKNKKTYSVTNFKDYSFQDLAVFFDEPIIEAAVHLGVSETYLKRLCRLLSIRRWPYRKIQSLLNQKAKLEDNLQFVTGKDLEKILVKTTRITERIDHLREFGTEIKSHKRIRVRQMSEKKRLKQEQCTPNSDFNPLPTKVEPMDFECDLEVQLTFERSTLQEWFLPCDNQTQQIELVWQDQVAPLGFKLNLDPHSFETMLQLF
jgi:biotin operon repressor